MYIWYRVNKFYENLMSKISDLVVWRVAIVFKHKWALHVDAVACTCIGTCTGAVAGTCISTSTCTCPGIGKVIRWTCVGSIDHMTTTSIEIKDQWK